MDIDLRGLQLSRWSPARGDTVKSAPPMRAPSKQAAARVFDDKDDEKAFNKITSLVPDGELVDKVWVVVQTLVAGKKRQARGVGAAETLQPLITKTVAAAIKTTIQEEPKELKGHTAPLRMRSACLPGRNMLQQASPPSRQGE